MSMFSTITVTAQLRLPAVIDDHMVLQRDQANNIWGWADAGADVTVSLMGKQYSTKAGPTGKWMLSLQPLKAGSAGDMLVTAGNGKKIVKDILVGEVWLCSGQSNMELPINEFKNTYSHAIQTAKDDQLRFVTVKNTFNNREAEDAVLKFKWGSINSKSILDCSATAYFFAKKLRERLNVPVGLIISAWSGTPAQSWMDTTSLKAFPNYFSVYQQHIQKINFDELNEIVKKGEEKFTATLVNANKYFKEAIAVDHDDSGWLSITVPKVWEEQGYPTLDGVAAYRISFNIPEGMQHKEARITMPGIDDVDSTYINGVFIGSQHVWNQQREYKIPSNVLKAGKNMIAIWVFDGGGGGGLQNDPEHFYVQLGTDKIKLNGNAKFKILAPVENIAPGINFASLQNEPGVLFNGMIAPLLPYGIKGAIWYQGESNTSAAVEYRELFPSMIKAWRKRFKNPGLPFLFVQLSSYNPDIVEPVVSDWALLREAQEYALRLPATGMAVTVDVGDQMDIHPQRKREVGERLAANAFKVVYGFAKEIATGPVYKSSSKKGNNIEIEFSNTGKGLMLTGDKLHGFSIAGANKNFIEADAIIQGNKVIVSSSTVKSPMYIRYAWGNAPLDANLYNGEGFPAIPFRTDK